MKLILSFSNFSTAIYSTCSKIQDKNLNISGMERAFKRRKSISFIEENETVKTFTQISWNKDGRDWIFGKG